MALYFQITGGSSGIGKELAAEAIRRGAEVVTIVARTEVPHTLNLKLLSVITTGVNAATPFKLLCY